MSVIQNTWIKIIEKYPQWEIAFFGDIAVSVLSFWIPSVTFLLISVYLPRFSVKHQLQAPKKQPKKSEIIEAIRVSGRNSLLSVSLAFGRAYLEKTGRLTPRNNFDRQLPSLSRVIFQLGICLILRDLLFYYSHLALHSRMFYTKIHKIHHRFTAPIAFASQYAHPFEHIVSNISPVVLPTVFVRMHVLVAWAFIASQTFYSCVVHSGFDFFFSLASFHDLHHEKFNYNYGTLGIFDWLHGTSIKSKYL